MIAQTDYIIQPRTSVPEICLTLVIMFFSPFKIRDHVKWQNNCLVHILMFSVSKSGRVMINVFMDINFRKFKNLKAFCLVVEPQRRLSEWLTQWK